ncbi:MAG: DUF87 domain-containing protein, partial [Candidatus Hydrothermarchaeales archaeon]
INLNVTNTTNIADIDVDADVNSKNLAGSGGQVEEISAENSNVNISINASRDYVGASLSIIKSNIIPSDVSNQSDNIDGYVSIEPSDNLNASLNLTTISICFNTTTKPNETAWGLRYFNGTDWEVVNGSQIKSYTWDGSKYMGCVEGNSTHFSVYGIGGSVYGISGSVYGVSGAITSTGGGGGAPPPPEPTCYDKIVDRFNLTVTPEEIVEESQPIAFTFGCTECADIDSEVTLFEFGFDDAEVTEISSSPFELDTSNLSRGNHSLYYKIELDDYPPIECTKDIRIVEEGYLEPGEKLLQKAGEINWSTVNESIGGIQGLLAFDNITRGPMELESTLEDVRIKPCDSRMFFVTVSNNLDEDIASKVEISGKAAAFASMDSTPFTLEAGKSHTLDVPVTVPCDAQPGVYPGRIRLFGVGGEVLPISITVVPPEKAIIDVRTEVLTEALYEERILEFKANIYNLGRAGEVTDIVLSYAVVEAETEEIIAHGSKDLTLYAVLTHVEKIQLESVPPPGKYLLEVLVEFEGGSASAVSSFEVRRPLPWRLFAGIFTVLLMVAAGLRTQQLLEDRRKERAKYVLPLSTAKLPEAEPENAFVGKVTDLKAKAYLNLNDLTTHLFISGGTGFGKTIAAKVIAEEALKRDKAVIVVDQTLQWTGLLKKCADEKMLESYSEFGMKKDEAQSFNGNYIEIKDPNQKINVEQYMGQGEITVLGVSNLDPANLDAFVTNLVRAFFEGRRTEHKELKCLLVFENAHKLLPKYGGKRAYVQIEKCFREFRKWGIGVVLVSQAVTGFGGGVLGNVGMEIQMKTNLETDIVRVRKKYGEKYAQALVKQTKGVAMLHSAKYNEGQPYFVQFRPLLHSPARLPVEELTQRKEQALMQRRFERVIEELKKRNIDTYEFELNLGITKLKQGSTSLARVYFDSLKEKMKRQIGEEEFNKFMEANDDE